MKNILFILLFIYGASIIDANSSIMLYLDTKDHLEDQTPFNFTNPIPSKIKIMGNVDLSFYVNQAVVFQYRFRLEVPQGGGSNVNRSLLNWTDWINKDINEIVVPKLGKEGRYRFIVEYKTHTSNEIKKYEKLFDVYDTKPLTTTVTAQTKTIPSPDKVVPEPTRPVAGNRPVKPADNQDNTATTIKIDKNRQLNNKPVLAEDKPKQEVADKQVEYLPEKPVVVDKNLTKDYNLLLMESIRQKNAGLLRESVANGAGLNLKGQYGGNILHMLDDYTASEDLILILKNKGVSINEPDNYNNTPLHYAIIQGENLYARYLINQGANLNIKNQMDLSPLHLAVLFNNSTAVKDLLDKGANVDILGNTGYTPLHIASQLDHTEIARDLLRNGANVSLKTDQNLSAKTIAKIQNNNNIVTLFNSRGASSIPPSKSKTNINQIKPYSTYPKIDFNLLYDPISIKNRKTAKVIQMVSAPVFALCAAGATYLKLEADNYYSLYNEYKTIEDSRDIAKYNYDKTLEYDTYFYISGGISVVSLYTFFHSTIWKRNVTNRMRKKF
ncbi:MAG: ankyrin repeat domain-containing protein [Bacteroidales bacterium]|nr:ankyrin repeat domain-containing protein [Bacteroidales bacterium]